MFTQMNINSSPLYTATSTGLTIGTIAVKGSPLSREYQNLLWKLVSWHKVECGGVGGTLFQGKCSPLAWTKWIGLLAPL